MKPQRNYCFSYEKPRKCIKSFKNVEGMVVFLGKTKKIDQKKKKKAPKKKKTQKNRHSLQKPLTAAKRQTMPELCNYAPTHCKRKAQPLVQSLEKPKPSNQTTFNPKPKTSNNKQEMALGASGVCKTLASIMHQNSPNRSVSIIQSLICEHPRKRIAVPPPKP